MILCRIHLEELNNGSNKTSDELRKRNLIYALRKWELIRRLNDAKGHLWEFAFNRHCWSSSFFGLRLVGNNTRSDRDLAQRVEYERFVCFAARKCEACFVRCLTVSRTRRPWCMTFVL